MIAPWPGMSRGTERSVPMVPGFVRVTVTPAKSSTVSLLVFALRIISSYCRGELCEVHRVGVL